jgi:pyruvate dehydrogenase E1 component
MGEAGEGRNTTHQQKKLTDDEMRDFRDRFDIPVRDDQLHEAPLYVPDEKSEEIRYLKERRAALGGSIPHRVVVSKPLDVPKLDFFKDFLGGSGTQSASTTMAYVRMLASLLKHPGVGKRQL